MIIVSTALALIKRSPSRIWIASVTLERRTPSIMERKSWVMGNSLRDAHCHQSASKIRRALSRRSHAGCASVVQTKVIEGVPDPKHISTSYIERSNLTLPMHNRRFTRLTNAFSKKFEAHVHMVAL